MSGRPVQDHVPPTAPALRTSKWYLNPVRTLAVLGLLATGVGCFASAFWIADLFAQFRIQWAIGLIGVALLLAVLRQPWWVGLCVIGVLINGLTVWPYLTTGSQSQWIASDGTLSRQTNAPMYRLLSLNVLSSNRSYRQVRRLIEAENPDFIVFMEVNANWERELDALRQTYPFAKFQTREDNFGIAFLSKRSWSKIEVFHSSSLRLPSIDVRLEGEWAGTNSQNRDLRIILTHPIPPTNPRNWMARNQQLVAVAKRFDENSTNIMVGDLNLTPWSPHFSRILHEGRLVDSALGFGVTPTWYVFPNWLGGLQIDHILVNEGVHPLRFRVGPDVGSDHRPVTLDFGISDPGGGL